MSEINDEKVKYLAFRASQVIFNSISEDQLKELLYTMCEVYPFAEEMCFGDEMWSVENYMNTALIFSLIMLDSTTPDLTSRFKRLDFNSTLN